MLKQALVKLDTRYSSLVSVVCFSFVIFSVLLSKKLGEGSLPDSRSGHAKSLIKGLQTYDGS